MGKKLKKGQAGNAVQYVTRNQALKKLQIHLGEFRRLCILKGIHPREPKRKTQGQNKTYYHVKDISFLAHEPLLEKLREQYAYEKKIRKAKAKKNAELAERLATRAPTYTLDRLVKERYPAFIDALRDMDDPLTMVHLFASLPAEKAYKIPASQVRMARRLALEWQAYVVRTHSLRKVFASVKGFYYQAEVQGQTVTWLVPHALSLVLPADVDYRVMLTFLEFYSTMLKFMHFKLYTAVGARYPPKVDEKLEAAAAGITAIMQDIASAAAALPPPPQNGESTSGEHNAEAEVRLQTLQDKLRELQQEGTAQPAAASAVAEPCSVAEAEGGQEAESDDDLGAPSIDSGEESDSDADEAVEGTAEGTTSADADAEQQALVLSTSHLAAMTEADEELGAAMSVAGGSLNVDENDEAAVCGALFKGLVFYMGREVPREHLLLVIRSFGGVAAWDGEGSPYSENHESITHQVVDRPTQGHRFLSREYVQPQWILDSANFRVLASPAKYAPGAPVPPHLSPFVNDDEEGYVPDYAKELRKLQAAASAARRRASGQAVDNMFADDAEGDDAVTAAPVDPAELAEAQHRADLLKEVKAAEQGGDGEDDEEMDDAETAAEAAPAPVAKAAPVSDEAAMANIMMTRKTRKMYDTVMKAKSAKRDRATTLEQRAKRVKPAEKSA